MTEATTSDRRRTLVASDLTEDASRREKDEVLAQAARIRRGSEIPDYVLRALAGDKTYPQRFTPKGLQDRYRIDYRRTGWQSPFEWKVPVYLRKTKGVVVHAEERVGYVTNTNGSFRADLITVARTMVALMPGIIEVPLNGEGKPSFRLEHLAPANGFTDMQAHDALGDVRATLFMAKLLQTRAPKLFDYLVSLGQPKVCDGVIGERMFLLMTHFGEPRVHLVGQVASAPGNAKQVGCFDLSYDPTPYLDMTPRQLADAMATDFKILRTVKTNAQPMIFSLDAEAAPAVTVNENGETVTRELAAERFAAINAHPTFRRNFLEALDIRQKAFEKPANVEEQIYDGFPSREDERRMEDFHRAHSWKERLEIVNAMEDQRLRKLGFRLVLFFGSDALAAANRKQWLAQMHRDRILSGEEKPWTTLKTAREGLAEIADEKLRAHYASWYDQLEQSITGQEAA